MIVRKAMFVT